jgi:hypothetical protein
MRNNYKKYHSDVKVCYALGIQNKLLPDTFIESIPNTTSHYWKNQDPDKYVGGEFSSGIQNALDDTKIFLDKRLTLGRKAFSKAPFLYLQII